MNSLARSGPCWYSWMEGEQYLGFDQPCKEGGPTGWFYLADSEGGSHHADDTCSQDISDFQPYGPNTLSGAEDPGEAVRSDRECGADLTGSRHRLGRGV